MKIYSLLFIFIFGMALIKNYCEVNRADLKLEIDNAPIPKSLTISEGEKVAWVNKSEHPQLFTFLPQNESEKTYNRYTYANTAKVYPGKSFIYQFKNSGKYEYIYQINQKSKMLGIIIVE